MISALEGLRAFGALSVATSHSWPSLVKELAWFNGSYLVVEMFFVLSGFLVAKVYSARMNGGREAMAIIVKRLGRLYPLHLFVLFSWIGLMYGKQLIYVLTNALNIDLGMTPPGQQNMFDAGYFFLNLLMLHGIGIQDSLLFNFPAWSISVEFWSFCIVAVVLALSPSRKVRIVSALIGIILCASHYGLTLWQTGMPAAESQPVLFKVVTRGVYAYFVGTLAYELCALNHRTFSTVVIGLAQLLCVTAIMLLVPYQQAVPFSQLIVPLFWAWMIVLLTSERGWLNSLLSVKPMVWVGQRSYSLYMTHSLLLLTFQKKVVEIGDFWLSNIGYLAYLAMALTLSHLTWRWIEPNGFKPFKQLADRIKPKDITTARAPSWKARVVAGDAHEADRQPAATPDSIKWPISRCVSALMPGQADKETASPVPSAPPACQISTRAPGAQPVKKTLVAQR